MRRAHETLVSALQDLLKLEELAVANLSEVGRYDFSCLTPSDQKIVLNLLKKLREDTGEHERTIVKIIQRLQL